MTVTSQVFDLLDNSVRKITVSRFLQPTEIQKAAIPKVISGENVLIIAETGSGKTESCMIPIFNRIAKEEMKPIAVLYITPLKSLNRDMFSRLLWWSEQLDLDASVRHGDTTQHERKLQVEHPPHLLITTPEQLNAMLVGEKMLEHLKNVKCIVVDEIHETIESKRGIQLVLALERLRRVCKEPQIIALSATVGSPERAAKFIFGDRKFSIVNAVSMKRLEISVEHPYPNAEDRIAAEKIFVGEAVVARLRKIHDLILKSRSTIMFTNTREAAELLSSRLRVYDKELLHDVHHSSLAKEVRIKAEKEFKEERLKALIATSSLELGIDIGAIELVIQYMSPRQVSKLIQRVGRSGHSMEKISKGIILAGEGDDVFESAVIARKALDGELEELTPYKKCLDVLVHQIIGETIRPYEADIDELYKTFSRSSPYKDMTKEEFLNLIKFMEEIKLIFIEKNLIKRKRKALLYYFENLSTIPTTRNYRVVDIATNESVGVLDEEFIAEHGETGSTFIVKGRPWRIVSVENDKVFVDSSGVIESAIPGWDGELIPVTFEIAQEVGELRRKLGNLVQSGMSNEQIKDAISKKYPVSENVIGEMLSIIKRQKEEMPDDKTIVFERYAEYVVMHCCFGSMVNETLSRYISSLISAEDGRAVFSKTDPYRIIFQNLQVDRIKKVLLETQPEMLRTILSLSLPNSSIYKNRFIRVAKRFGIIAKDAQLEFLNIGKLIDIYKDSPLGHETLNEIYTEKLDLDSATRIVGMIQEKKIRIREIEGLTALGEYGLRYELTDVMKPNRPEAEILKLFRERLLNTKIRMVCLTCGRWAQTEQARDIPESIKCPKCDSKLIAAVSPFAKEVEEIVKKKIAGLELTDAEQKRMDSITLGADIVLVNGKRAVIALAGRGVGPQTATTLLSKHYRSEEEFLKAILAAERNFIATKRFWH